MNNLLHETSQYFITSIESNNKPKVLRINTASFSAEDKASLEQKLTQNNYLFEYDQSFIDAVHSEVWNDVQESKKPKTDLTVVTGLWNIGRPGRPFDKYLELFDKLLDTPNNMFIFISKEHEHIVWKKRNKRNTFVKVYELEDIKNLFSPFWDRVQKIRDNPDWFNQADWLKSSPQRVLEWYNPIVMSKMFMLHDVTIWNPFNNNHFVWLDAGITNTVYEKYFTENKILDKTISFMDPFFFLCYPYETNSEIHGFKKDMIDKFARKPVKWVGRGGLFGGTKEAIHEANNTYYSLLDQTLNNNCMGTEESIFAIMTHAEPHKYRRYMLDENGLIVKFAQALIDNTAELEPLPARNVYTNKPTVFELDKIKTYVYILTFNFPQQLRVLLDSFKFQPDFLSKTNKVLIDNSTDPKAVEENQKIANDYGFVHYKHFDNIGINGGRQYAAEHFDASDGDYYIFFEDDMCLQDPNSKEYCRNGFRYGVQDLYNKVHKIMIREKLDFLKFSYTEVYMDNNIQVSWYNVPQNVRTELWSEYDMLPVSGLDPNCPRTNFKTIEVFEGLSFITGEIYYCNWPMIVSKKGNKKMFIETKWAHPYEQTWMSHMFQETRKGNLNPAVLLAAPINHNRIIWYKPEERREN